MKRRINLNIQEYMECCLSGWLMALRSMQLGSTSSCVSCLSYYFSSLFVNLACIADARTPWTNYEILQGFRNAKESETENRSDGNLRYEYDDHYFMTDPEVNRTFFVVVTQIWHVSDVKKILLHKREEQRSLPRR